MVMFPSELRLGDVIKTFDGPWGTAIVKNVTEHEVELFRPYGHNADFSMTSGILCYVGIEQYKIPKDSKMQYEVYRRQEIR